METSSLNFSPPRDACNDDLAFDDAPANATNCLTEAARYALLQRLAPAIQHQIAGSFQPIVMLASMMQRLMQAPNADLTKIGAHCAAMLDLATSGATNNLKCFTWLAETEHADVRVNDGVAECLKLVAAELAVREFTVVNNLETCTATWPRNGLRNVFMAALFAITDSTLSPAELVLSAETTVNGPALTLQVFSADDATVREAMPVYRKIDWLDVEMLAAAEGVSVECSASGARLFFLLPNLEREPVTAA